MTSPVSPASLLPAAAASAGILLALVWVAYLVRLYRAGRAVPPLPPNEGPATEAARLSVVVAAKDEEEGIESCVRSLMAQDYPTFDLIVVNDRSSDRTGDILGRLGREFGNRLNVLTVTDLPEGWGGQNHALRKGVDSSTAEWLCFTDADCTFDSVHALSTAWAEARVRGLDLLSILPAMETSAAWEKIYLPLCGGLLLDGLRIGDVNRPEKPAAYANGAFLLIRREVYEKLGGHGQVRKRVHDDLLLARMAKQQGYRLRVAANGGLYRTRMYGSLREAWDGWTRNFGGALEGDNNLGKACVSAFGLFLLPWIGFLPALGATIMIGPAWAAAAVAWGVAAGIGQLGLAGLYASMGVGPLWSLLHGPGALFVLAVLLRAATRAWRKKETVWQGARYDRS